MLDYATLDGFVLHDDAGAAASALVHIQGITGPTGARGDAIDRDREDGSVEPPTRYQNGRLITLEGEVWPPSIGTPYASIAAAENAAWLQWDDLAAILVKGLTEPLDFVWRRAGDTVDRTTVVRVADQSEPDFSADASGPIIRYAVHLNAPDPNHYGAAKTANAAPPTSNGGFEWPAHWPVNFGIGVGGDADVTNAGNATTWPRFTITGPVISPAIVNQTLGEGIYLDGLSLAAGDTLYVDTRPGFRVATVNGSDVRSTIRWAQSRYFTISPRATETIRFYGKGGGYTAASSMRIDYADAYAS